MSFADCEESAVAQTIRPRSSEATSSPTRIQITAVPFHCISGSKVQLHSMLFRIISVSLVSLWLFNSRDTMLLKMRSSDGQAPWLSSGLADLRVSINHFAMRKLIDLRLPYEAKLATSLCPVFCKLDD